MKRLKLLSALLAALLACGSISLFTVSTVAEEATAASYDYDLPAASGIDEDGINTMGELAYAIKNGTEGQTVTLSGDIDMGGVTSNNADFGTLKNNMVIDGAGYAIYNCTMLGWSASGLFSAASNAHITIKNLDIGTSKQPVSASFGGASWPSLGILIGTGKNGNSGANGTFSFDIENVNIYADIARNTKNAKSATYGAMIGYATLPADTTSTIKNCKVYDTNGIENTAGFAAGFIGGVKGTGALVIESCVNYANISNGGTHTAGFVAVCQTEANITFRNCVNLGDVTSTGGNAAAFIALTENTSIKIENCVNVGDVKGSVASQALASATNTAGIEVKDCAYIGTVTGTDNVSADDAETNGNVFYSATAASVKALNTLVGDSAFTCGTHFYLDNSGDVVSIKFDQSTPTLVGAQKTAVTDGKFDVRFVAVIKEDDLALYRNAGFKVSVKAGETVGETKDLRSSVMFKTLKAGAVNKSYTAEELGGEYIIALSVTDIPATGTVVFTIAPYATENTVSGINTLSGTVWTLTYTDGTFISAAVVED